MINLQINPVAVIAYIEQQVALVPVKQLGAYPRVFLMNLRPKISGLQIIPKQAVSKNIQKMGKALQRLIQSLLQRRLLDPLGQLAGKAEHSGIPLAAGGRENLAHVIQLKPATCLIHPFHPRLKTC